MKSGGRGKEPPVAGEVTVKRPKRKCLQWHPLLSKKTLDFSEEEEEEDEEDLEKVSVLWCGTNCTFISQVRHSVEVSDFIISSQCCAIRTRTHRCRVEAQQKKLRMTPVNSEHVGQ